MRRPPNGTPFVPPNPLCPAEQQGHLPDLSAVPFELIVNVVPGGSTTEVYGLFDVRTDPGGDEDIIVDSVQTANITLPSSSPLARKLQELTHPEEDPFGALGWTDNTRSPIVERARISFCNRVAICKGVIDGECWALGTEAVQEVIGQTLDDSKTG